MTGFWRMRALTGSSGRGDHSSRLAWLNAYGQLRPNHPQPRVRFSVIVDATKGSRSELKTTINSVFSQTHTAWDLTAITQSFARRAGSSNGRIRFRSATPSFPEAADSIVLQQSTDHVILLRTGDTLRSDALAWLSSVAQGSDVVYCDGGPRDAPNSLVFKPAWSPRLLLTLSYLDGLVSVSREAFLEAGGLSAATKGPGLTGLTLRLAEVESLAATHLPMILRTQEAVDRVILGREEIEGALERRGWKNYKVEAGIDSLPLIRFTDARDLGIKVVLPTRDRPEDLEKAVKSVLAAKGVEQPELIIVDNRSTDRQALDYLDSIKQKGRATVVRVDEPFNFSRLCNIGAATGSRSPALLFLNNDIEALDPQWIAQLGGWLVNDDRVAAVAPQLRYPDGTVQFGGTILGMGGLAGHYAVHLEPSAPGLHQHAREVAALTAACLLVRTADFESVGGFSEDLPTDFQDVDFSLKLRDKGRVLMYDPTYPLLHVEGATRGRRDVEPETQRTFFGRWERTVLEGDPYYSPHLADGRSDPERGWVHDPNLLRDLPATDDEARLRVRPRRSS